MRKALKKQNGITLASLVITTIVSLVLSGVAINYSTDSIDHSKYTAMTSEIQIVQEKINVYYSEGKELSESNLNDTHKSILQSKGVSSDKYSNYYYFAKSDLRELLDMDSIEGDYLISIEDMDVICLSTIKKAGNEYSNYRVSDITGSIIIGGIKPGDTANSLPVEHTHNYTNFVEKVSDATCTTKERNKYSCSICGLTTIKEEGNVLGHSWDAGKVTTNPTCTAEGVKTYTCTRTGCNETKTESIATVGHTEDSGSVTGQPTCTTEGTKTFKCTVCSEVLRTEKIDALGHTPGAEATCTEAQVCTVCNIELAPAKGHTPGAEATCTETQKCTVCNTELAPAKGHTEDSGSVTKEPTCTVEGTKTFKCTVCSEVLRTETIYALGHTEVNGGTADAHTKCSVCNEILSTEHSYTEKVTKEPTCTTVGEKTFTCDCGYVYTEEIAAKGHTPGAEATCTTPQVCTICNAELAPAKGHTEDAGSVTLEPTCVAEGTRTFKCIVCGEEVRTEKIAVNPDNHTGETTEEYENIDSEYHKVNTICSGCGEVISTNTVGHNWTALPTTSCMATYECENCGSTKEEIATEGEYLVDTVEIGDYVDIDIDYLNTESFASGNTTATSGNELTGWRVLNKKRKWS